MPKTFLESYIEKRKQFVSSLPPLPETAVTAIYSDSVKKQKTTKKRFENGITASLEDAMVDPLIFC